MSNKRKIENISINQLVSINENTKQTYTYSVYTISKEDDHLTKTLSNNTLEPS